MSNDVVSELQFKDHVQGDKGHVQGELFSEPAMTVADMGKPRLTADMLDRNQMVGQAMALARQNHPAFSGSDIEDFEVSQIANKGLDELAAHANAYGVQHPLPKMDYFGDRRDLHRR